MKPWTSIDNNRALQFFNLSRFSANFLSGWVLVKAGLSIEEISVYETLLFLGNLFTFYWHSGGQNALVSYFPKLSEVQGKKLLFNVFILFCGLSFISAGALWLSKDFISVHFRQFESLPYMLWLCLYIALNIPAYLLHIFFLLHNEPRHIVIYASWSFFLQFLVVILPVLLGWSLEYVFMGLAALALIRFLYTLYLLRSRSTIALDFSLMKAWVIMMIPLSLHILVGNGMEYIDGWLVNNFFSDAGTFAIFRYGARELPLVGMVVGALTISSIPLVAANQKAGMASLKKETLALAKWLYPVSILLLFLSPILFPLFYDENFLDSAWIFNIYLLILAFRLLMPQVILIGTGKRYFLVISAIFETILNITLSLWWVEPFGLWGIAGATVVANAFDKLSLMTYCWFKLGIKPQDYIPWRTLLVLNFALGLGFYLSFFFFYD